MANKAEFTKGQQVNVYFGDHSTAAVKVVAYTVASCGVKRMHLIRADGSNAEWSCRAPFRGNRQFSDVQAASVDPVAHAAALRRQFATWIQAHYADRTARAEQGLANGDIGARGYADGIAQSKAAFEAATADIVW